MGAPVESKVQASTAAAAVSGLALWSLGHWVFKGDVPDVVASWVYVLVPGALAFAAGYLARHTPRPGDPAGNMPAGMPAAPARPPAARADVSPLPDPPMQDLPGPAAGGTP